MGQQPLRLQMAVAARLPCFDSLVVSRCWNAAMAATDLWLT
jgi:hypothetical protein